MIVASETGSGLGDDFVSVEAYVEEKGSLGDADTDYQTEESAADPHSSTLGQWRVLCLILRSSRLGGE